MQTVPAIGKGNGWSFRATTQSNWGAGELQSVILGGSWVNTFQQDACNTQKCSWEPAHRALLRGLQWLLSTPSTWSNFKTLLTHLVSRHQKPLRRGFSHLLLFLVLYYAGFLICPLISYDTNDIFIFLSSAQTGALTGSLGFVLPETSPTQDPTPGFFLISARTLEGHWHTLSLHERIIGKSDVGSRIHPLLLAKSALKSTNHSWRK